MQKFFKSNTSKIANVVALSIHIWPLCRIGDATRTYIERLSPFLPRCTECRRGLPMRILSVCLSNACIVTKQKKDLSRFLYHMKDYLAKFSEKQNGWWGVTTSTWNSGSTVPRWGEIANVEPTFTSSASAVTPSEKVQLTRQEVHYAVFNEPKIIVRCPNPTPKGGSKTQNGRFRCKIALRLKKVCYKVSFCEKWQRQSC